MHFLLFFPNDSLAFSSFVVAFSVDTYRFFTVMSYSSASTYRRSRECGRPSGTIIKISRHNMNHFVKSNTF
jgi:hypothetical protein